MSQPSYPHAPLNDNGAPPIPTAPGFSGPSQGSTYQGRPGDGYQGGYQPDPYGNQQYPGTPGKSFVVTWLFSLLLGGLGVDRFYLGKVGTGVVKLLTLGGFGFWSIIDLIIVLTGNMKDKDGLPLEGYPEHKKKAWIVTAAVWLVSAVVGILYTVMSFTLANSMLDEMRRTSPEATQSADADPQATEAAPQPSTTTAGDGTSFTVTVSEGNTVKVGVIDAIYTQQIPQMDYIKPANGGFLAINVSWETLTGTSFASASNFKAYDADGKEAERIYLEDGLHGLASEDVAAGDARQGVVVFDVKKGPTTIQVTDDYGDKAATFTLTTQ